MHGTAEFVYTRNRRDLMKHTVQDGRNVEMGQIEEPFPSNKTEHQLRITSRRPADLVRYNRCTAGTGQNLINQILRGVC